MRTWYKVSIVTTPAGIFVRLYRFTNWVSRTVSSAKAPDLTAARQTADEIAERYKAPVEENTR